jgi:hypothetical protein
VHPIENGAPRQRLFAQPQQFRVGDSASPHESHALEARVLFRLIVGWGAESIARHVRAISATVGSALYFHELELAAATPLFGRAACVLVLGSPDARALARKGSVCLSAAHVAHQVHLELHIVRKLVEQLARVVLVEQQVGDE